MSQPIDFSVAAAERSGNFQTSNMTYPGGFSQLEWQLTGLGSGAGSDYENTANSFTATVQFSTDGGNTFNVYDSASWQGGPAVIKGVTDPTPTLAIGLGNLPTGCEVFVQIALTGTMNIGLSGSLS